MRRISHWNTWPFIFAVACGGGAEDPKGDEPEDDAGVEVMLDADTTPDPTPDASDDPMSDAGHDAGTTPDASDDSDASSTEDCPEGFELSGDECVAAPCSQLDCGENGACEETEGVAECACDTGFAGTLCDACAAGYEGDVCDTCAEGFVPDEGACVADVCVEVSCGEHGSCIDAEGNPECECDEGWAGDECDSCALGWASKAGACVLEPETFQYLRMWQDAAASSTLRFDDQGRVTEWRSRIEGEEEIAFEAGESEDSRPGRTLEGGSRPRITFDGDDALTRTLTLNNNAYTMYVVARWDAQATTQNLLAGTNAEATTQPLALYATKSSGVTYHHKFPYEILGGDAVTSDDYAPAEGLQVIVVQRNNLNDGYLRQYFGADHEETAPLTQSAISDPLLMNLGQNGLTTVGHLEGEIAEVLFYGGVHTQATRDQITTYLRAKWGLPVPGEEL